MPRTITAAMASNVAETSTRPIVVVDLYFSGALERVSCNGPITFDSNSYADSGVSVNYVEMDGGGATLKLPMTLDRSYQMLNDFWRDQPCVIWYIPGLPDDADDTYTLAEGYKVFEGIIDSCQSDGRMITVNCLIAGLRNKTLRHKFNDAFSGDFLLRSGTVLNWGTEDDPVEEVVREPSDKVTDPVDELSTGPGGGARTAGKWTFGIGVGSEVDPSVSTDADMWRYH